jgi:aminoglycoside/choline kinase family phosphotransferase
MTPSSANPASTADIVWSDPGRAAFFAQWLSNTSAASQLDPATLRLASADASFRRYFRIDRIDRAAGSCIIMDAPPALEDCAPFVKIAALMAEAGLNAPRVLAWDKAQGFMLLSDLGSQTMMQLIQQQAPLDPFPPVGSPIHQMYMDAVDALIAWQLSSRPGVLPAYDAALLSRELQLFPDWYIAKHRGITVDAGLQDKLAGFFAQIKDSNLNSLGGARVFVHRDFMPRNLMAPTLVAARTALPPEGAVPPWGGPAAGLMAPTLVAARTALPPEGAVPPWGGPAAGLMAPTLVAARTALPPEGAVPPWGGPAAGLMPPSVGSAESLSPSRLGVLDFQDAVYGPITYDIASLMRDAFLSWDEEFVLDITIRYWQKARKVGLPVGDDFGEFYRAVEWMGLQRHLKILGIFARLTLRDGKPHYLADTPRFIKYARSTASRYRQLGPLMVLLDEIEGNETRVGYTF